LFLLGIDTSTRKGILCLGKDGRVIAIEPLSERLTSEHILPALDSLLKKNGSKVKDLKGIVVSSGPGSFTGLRIGVSLAKSLTYAMKIPLVGISTLDVLALSPPLKGIVCPLLKAYGDEYYAQFYERRGENFKRLSEPLFLSLEKIIRERENLTPEKATFVLKEEEAEEIKKTGEPFFILRGSLPVASALLKLGEKRIKEGKKDLPSHLVPLYISSPSFKKTSERINIRQMRKEDIAAVSEIERVSFPNPWPAHAFLVELEKRDFAYYWVMEYQNRLVGYAGYWRIGDEAHLVNLAIHPSFRRKGLGERLMRFILEHIRDQGLTMVTLEVRQSNIAAQKLYEKLGFQKIAIRPHYYNTEDAIIYWKKM